MQMRNLGEEQQLGVEFFNADMDSSQYHANLISADLECAYLKDATLPHESKLYRAKLPDGKRHTISTDYADMKKYTDANHPDFAATLEVIERNRWGNRAIASSDV